MKPYFEDEWLTVLLGDCREAMASMEPGSVNCVVTSPPYWGLRDYGTPGQLGLEATPEAYVEAMVGVFREVRRVLRDDGTVWLNLGDSYAGSGKGPSNRPEQAMDGISPIGRNPGQFSGGQAPTEWLPIPAGLKGKDLVGIPWRVAFALQADGWYLRSDIIWSKPNPMPESVTDRPTKSHEYLFLLSKSARYYFDGDAVREPMLAASVRRFDYAFRGTPERNEGMVEAHHGKGYMRSDEPHPANPGGRNLRSVWTIATQPYPGAHFATFPEALVEPCVKAGSPDGGVVLDPFAGSGTTGLVANRLGRRAVLIDLSADYLGQVMVRNAQKPLGLSGEVVA